MKSNIGVSPMCYLPKTFQKNSSNKILNNSPAILEILEWRIDQEVVLDMV